MKNKNDLIKYPARDKDKKRSSRRDILERRRKEEVDQGRRLVVKGIFVALTSALVSYYSSNKLKDYLEKKLAEPNEKAKKPVFEVKNSHEEGKKELSESEKRKREDDAVDMEDEGEKELLEEDAKSLEEIINFNSPEKLVLNDKTTESLKNHWKELYENRLKLGLDQAWSKMGFWEGSAKEKFLLQAEKYCAKNEMGEKEKKAFLTEFKEFFYLAIPESHWDIWADSGWAKGPFQFTSSTGKLYGLKKGDNYDERTDPEKSASAAAQCLLDLYEDMDKDWNLVFSGYNGAFVWQYKKNQANKGEKLSHEGFLAYLSEEIEKIRQQALAGENLTHKIRRCDSWGKIARIYGCSEDSLKKINKVFLKKGLVFGAKVNLPPEKQVKKNYFYQQISGFSENINYPAKFLAIQEIIRERKVKNDLPRKEKAPVFVTENRIRQKNDFKRVILTRKDTLASLAGRFSSSVGELMAINKIKEGKFSFKKSLLVPGERTTLLSLAGGNRNLVEVMHKLNPAIQDVSKPLPDGVRIKMLTLSDFLVAKKTEK